MRQLILVTLLFVAGLTAPAQAQAANNVALAKKLFKEAEAKFAEGDYRGALERYEKAYEAKPLAGFHFNIGQCHRNLGEYKDAIEHFEKYLASSKNPRNRADAEKLLELSRADLAREQAAAKPEPQPEPAPVETTAPKPTPVTPAPTENKPFRLPQIYFWSGVGVSAALLLTGTITGALALKKSSDYNDANTPAADLTDLKDSGEALRTTSTVTFTLGAVAAAGTAALYFFTDFGAKERAVAVSPIQGGALVSMGGVF